jgi:hypothetical protein
MRRFTIGLAVVFTLLLVASVASAVPPGFCDDKPDHHQCTTTTTTEPPVTTTETPGIPPCATVTNLQGAGAGMTCLWTPDRGLGEIPSTGLVTVETTSGELSSLVIWVRDDEPGDICVLEQLRKPGTGTFVASFPLATGSESYWGEPTHWCSRFDPAPGIRDDLNGEPLHVEVSFDTRANRVASVVVTLEPGQDSAASG